MEILDKVKNLKVLEDQLEFDRSKANQLIDEGVMLKRLGKYNESLEKYVEGIYYYPEMGKYNAFGKILYLLGEYRLAAAFYYWAYLAEVDAVGKNPWNILTLKSTINKINSNPYMFNFNNMIHFTHAVLADQELLNAILLPSEIDGLKNFAGTEMYLYSYSKVQDDYTRGLAGGPRNFNTNFINLRLKDNSADILLKIFRGIIDSIIKSGDMDLFNSGVNLPKEVLAPIKNGVVLAHPQRLRDMIHKECK